MISTINHLNSLYWDGLEFFSVGCKNGLKGKNRGIKTHEGSYIAQLKQS